jgi:hypothetical protein
MKLVITYYLGSSSALDFVSGTRSKSKSCSKFFLHVTITLRINGYEVETSALRLLIVVHVSDYTRYILSIHSPITT